MKRAQRVNDHNDHCQLSNFQSFIRLWRIQDLLLTYDQRLTTNDWIKVPEIKNHAQNGNDCDHRWDDPVYPPSSLGRNFRFRLRIDWHWIRFLTG